jgi:GNAT superfamily N-acetyltransferase
MAATAAEPAPAGLVIRPATAADRIALDEQELGLNLFENALVGDRNLTAAGSTAAMDKLHQRVANSRGVVLVAEISGAVVGHLVLAFERFGPYVREELRDYALVADLFVRADHRGRGIGRALITEAERRAIERAMPRILLGVVHGNHAAERSYRRQGFRDYALELVKELPAQGGGG